jgi:ABC-2 type transport system ATP-binding protein
MSYAIETIELVKKYPTTARRGRPHPGEGFRGGRRVDSLQALFNILGGHNGFFVEALRGVSLQIKEGEVFGLLGPNGAGKTTLIKILCTLVTHDAGEAYVHGFDVKKRPLDVLKKLQAILPESRGFDWRLSGRQNLEFYALLYGVKDKEAKERIDYLLGFTGLKDRADDGYQRYSTGMQRKLLLCRALLRNTSTLLFDEPTTGLDPASAADFRNLLRDKLSRGEGKTVLVSTHNLGEAQEICDRVAILNRGKIMACDRPDNVQHLVFDTKIFSISFFSAAADGEGKEMLSTLKALPGILQITPEEDAEGKLLRIGLEISKDVDLNSILEIIVASGLKISAVNTEEPTLEDVFMSLTAKKDI